MAIELMEGFEWSDETEIKRGDGVLVIDDPQRTREKFDNSKFLETLNSRIDWDNVYVGPVKGQKPVFIGCSIAAKQGAVQHDDRASSFEIRDKVYTLTTHLRSLEMRVPKDAPLAIIAITRGVDMTYGFFENISLENGHTYAASQLALGDDSAADIPFLPESIADYTKPATKKGYVEDVPGDPDDIMKAVRDMCRG